MEIKKAIKTSAIVGGLILGAFDTPSTTVEAIKYGFDMTSRLSMLIPAIQDKPAGQDPVTSGVTVTSQVSGCSGQM